MVKDLTITSLEKFTLFDITTGDLLAILDEMQEGEISQSQDTQDITGKGGRKLSSIKRNKAVKVTGKNGLVSAGLLELQTGSEFTNGTASVRWADYLTVGSEHTAITSYTATGTAGAEIVDCYIRNSDGTLGTQLEQASAAAAGKFAYTPGTKTLTFHTDVAENTEVVVFYNRNITGDSLINSSDTVSGKCKMYIDALAEDTCANVYRVQFYIPKADFSGEFSLTLGNDQTVHSFEAEALAGSCGQAGQFFTYTVFDSAATDPTA